MQSYVFLIFFTKIYMKNNSAVISIFSLIIFAFSTYYFSNVCSIFEHLLNDIAINDSIKMSIVMTLSCITISLLPFLVIYFSDNRDILTKPNFKESFQNGLPFAFLTLLILFAIFLFLQQKNAYHGINLIFIFNIFFYYFLGFQQLFKHTNLGFLPITIIVSIISMLPNWFMLKQLQYFPIFGMTFLENFIAFLIVGWIYIEWKYNFWLLCFLSVMTDFFFAISHFESVANAEQPFFKNPFFYKILTYILVIIFTFAYKKMKKVSFTIYNSNIWKKTHIK